jgi:hypothetical protein
MLCPASQTDIAFPTPNQNLPFPKLEDDGSNWVLFKVKILSALTYWKMICYVDGWAQKPKAPSTSAAADVKEKYKNDLETWEIRNEHAWSIILSTLPESYQIKVIGLKTAAEAWKMISSKFNNQSEIVQIDLLQQINQTRCAEDADPCETIQTLQTLWAKYASAGRCLTDI